MKDSKKKIAVKTYIVVLFLLLSVPSFSRTLSSAVRYSDVSQDAWYYPFVEAATQEGIMNGFPDATFRPYATATRAQVATVIFRLLYPQVEKGIIPVDWDNITSKEVFKDVGEGDWFKDATTFLALEGIISGFPDGTFQPDKPVTRAEAAAFYAKALNGGEFTEEQKERFAQIAAEKYSDMSASDWSSEYVGYLTDLGILGGYPDKTFRPDRDVTRAEAAALTTRTETFIATKGLAEGLLIMFDNGTYDSSRGTILPVYRYDRVDNDTLFGMKIDKQDSYFMFDGDKRVVSLYIRDIDNETVKNYIQDVFGKADQYGYINVPVDSLAGRFIRGMFGNDSFIGRIRRLSDGNFYYFDPDNLTAYAVSPERLAAVSTAIIGWYFNDLTPKQKATVCETYEATVNNSLHGSELEIEGSFALPIYYDNGTKMMLKKDSTVGARMWNTDYIWNRCDAFFHPSSSSSSGSGSSTGGGSSGPGWGFD